MSALTAVCIIYSLQFDNSSIAGDPSMLSQLDVTTFYVTQCLMSQFYVAVLCEILIENDSIGNEKQ